MKRNLTLVLTVLIATGLQQANAQANTKLSNLVSPTAVNQTLTPNNDSVRSLGTAAKSWNVGFLYQLKLKKNRAGNGSILNANGIELGYGVAGKEINAGKIAYAEFTPNALDIVGAGNSFATRAIKFWAEDKAIFTGKVGIGTNTPSAQLYVTTQTQTTATYSASNAISGIGITGEANNSSTFSYPKGVQGICSNPAGWAGYFSGDLGYTGTLYDVSDQRLKENIKPMDRILDKVMQLKPSMYNFRSEYSKMNLPKGEQVGFIAQDLEKVFPQLVKTTVDKPAGTEKEFELKTVNYIGLIPLLTKAIQDQQEEINELKQEVKRLSGNAAQSENTSAANGVTVSDAVLNQNNPNPFTNSTTVQYNIPARFKSAQIVIADANGSVIKQISINTAGKGTVTVNAYNLSSGTYTYALVVDGKTIESKKMMVAK